MSKIIIDLTKEWIEEFIIALQICPFAALPMFQGLVDFHSFDSTSDEEFLPEFLNYLVHFIDERNDFSNAFLVVPNYESFEKYLTLYYKCEELLNMSGSDTIVQLASFHPDYRYTDTPVNDPSNYRNKAPYAMIHLLRVAEVESAIESFGDTTKISLNNINQLKSMKTTDLEKLVSKFKG